MIKPSHSANRNNPRVRCFQGRRGMGAILFAACIIAAPLAHAQSNRPSPESLELAREYISLTLQADLARNMSQEGWTKMERQLREKNPNISVDTLAELKPEYQSYQIVLAEELVKNAAPIYVKYFNEDELRALVAFQTSDVGKKLKGTLPQLMQEIMPQVVAETQRSGLVIDELFNEELKKRGLTLE